MIEILISNNKKCKIFDKDECRSVIDKEVYKSSHKGNRHVIQFNNDFEIFSCPERSEIPTLKSNEVCFLITYL